MPTDSPQPLLVQAPLNQILFGPPGTGKPTQPSMKLYVFLIQNFLKKYENDRTALKPI